MKEKVYLDSSIPSYYFDQRESIAIFIEITKKWWSEMASSYDIFISDAVFQELNSGNYLRKKEIINFISNIPLLPLNNDIEQIVEFYISNYIMPSSLVGDAVHLAYASFYDIHYLLTWNCNHLANANKRKHIQVINGRLGLSTPEIITPLELFKEDEE
ncbi:MAG: type II toxin-antitoxin system VapC family toxin [Thiomargarita sp.]|nr:type II toxin-antitoxin system VapC family toxin [Thiomargarita sp.]